MKTFPLLLAMTATSLAATPEPKFTAQDLDTKIEIGYGVAVADVDGDGKPDVLLADKKQFVWYRNPGKRGAAWDKFILAENLTEKDNVCIAAQDIDGDGKCEIAVGAEWNPGDTVNSGAVFYLIAPADRTQKWEAVKFPSVEPTTHRMKWVKRGTKEQPRPGYELVVVPLHGRGNTNGEGEGVKVIAYQMPKNPRGEWKAEVLDNSMHATHNFDADSMLLAGKEGVRALLNQGNRRVSYFLWASKAGETLFRKEPHLLPGNPLDASPGAGEIRSGSWPNGVTFNATIEPMHGNQLVVQDYLGKAEGFKRIVLTDKLNEGHALACGPVLGGKGSQIVVGFRGNPKNPKPVGIRLWTPLDNFGEKWRESIVDDNTMACEDLELADLDGDGKLDIVASGRATKNVKIYWNER